MLDRLGAAGLSTGVFLAPLMFGLLLAGVCRLGTVRDPRTLIESSGMTVDGAGYEGFARGGSDRAMPWTPEELCWLVPPF